MKKIFLPVLLIPALALTARADIVFLRDGREVTGKFLGVEKGHVLVRKDKKRQSKFPLKEVLSVKFITEGGKTAARPGGGGSSVKITAAARDAEIAKLLAENPWPAAGESHLVWLHEVVYELKDNGGSVRTERTISKIFSERSRDAVSAGKFYYLEGYQKGALDYACAINGARSACADETTIQDGSEYPDFPDYNNLRSVKFAVPDAGAGTIVDYRYTVTSESHYKSFPFSGSFLFAGDAPARTARLKVIAPRGASIVFTLDNSTANVRYSAAESGGRNIYVWEARNQSALAREGDMPPDARAVPGVRFAYGDKWESIAAFFSAQLDKRLADATAADSILSGLLTPAMPPEEKARAVYGWVMKNIRYQPVEAQYSSYIPSPPAKIARAAAANAVDKPFLLYALLLRAGLNPSFAYLAPHDAPAEAAPPSIRHFAAAGVFVELGGRQTLLTPLEDWIKFGYTPSWLQGTAAVAVSGPLSGKGALLKTPCQPPRAESEDLVSKMALDADGNLSASAIIRPSGSYEERWRSLRPLRREELDKEMAALVRAEHPKARLKAYEIRGLDDMAASPEAELQYSIKGYAVKSSDGQYMALRLPGVAQPAGDVNSPARVYPLDFERLDLEKYAVSLAIPKDYEVYYLPESLSAEAAGMKYSAGYERTPAGLSYTEYSERGAPEIEPGDYAAYRNLRLQMATFADKWIVLKKSAPKPAQSAASVQSKNPRQTSPSAEGHGAKKNAGETKGAIPDIKVSVSVTAPQLPGPGRQLPPQPAQQVQQPAVSGQTPAASAPLYPFK